MSHFEFNPEQRNFPINGSTERSYPVKEPIDYRLWIVELIYVYSIGTVSYTHLTLPTSDLV